MKTKRITFRLTEDQETEVRAYCDGCGITPTALIRSLIQLFLLTKQR